MNPVLGVILIIIAAFIIFLIITYEWIDRRQFSADRNIVRASKQLLPDWCSYLKGEYSDNEEMLSALTAFETCKKSRKKIEAINAVQAVMNRLCDGDDEDSAKNKKIRKQSYNMLREFVSNHNILAEDYNRRMEKKLYIPAVKILRMKEFPLLDLRT